MVHSLPLAPEPEKVQEVAGLTAMPGTAEEDVTPMTAPMKEIVASSPHIDSNASEGDSMALLPRNTVRLNLKIFEDASESPFKKHRFPSQPSMLINIFTFY